MTTFRAPCFVHAQREAVARCMGCGRSYCRECVSEHAGQLRCARCLAAEAAKGDRNAERNRRMLAITCGALSLLAGLGAVQLASRQIVSVPDRFHDGSEFRKLVEP